LAPSKPEGREMGIGDRIFWSLVCFFVISLLWMKFIEPFIPLWGSLFVSGAVAFLIATFGRRSKKVR